MLTYAQQDLKQAARNAKVSTSLLTVINNGGNLVAESDKDGIQRMNLFTTDGDKIAIDAVANADGGELLQALQGMGLQQGTVSKQRVSGFLPISQLGNLKNVTSLRFARPSYRPKHNVGSVTSEGDLAMRASVARTTYGVSGAGVKVGILSDSYNARGGAAAGVASGDLPAAGVEVLSDLTGSSLIDEGRAMAELVHDIAPGSPIAFHTAFVSETDFAQGIRDLAAAGCKIITDDVSYFAEPFFQDGVIAQAIDDVVNNNGVTYFSSAGNSARQSYQSTYSPGPATVFTGYSNGARPAHNFGGGDLRQTFRLGPNGQSMILSFQWDDPFFSVSGGAGAQTDMDILVFIGGTYRGNLSGIEENTGLDPVELIGIVNNGTSAVDIELVLVKWSGPDPNIVKWVNFDSQVSVEYDTKSSTAVGHTNSTRCISVGAAPYYNTPAYNNNLTTAVIEPFSSAGGVPTYFTTTGTRLPAPVTRPKPEITAVDGTNTTFFYSDSSVDPDTYPNFFGTSAAAPHAAAVAALMKEKVPSITPAAILSALQNTALDMNDPSTPGFDTGFDYGTGFGFIQANRALEAITDTPPPAGVFSITGVTTVSCTNVSPGRRALVFNPTYSSSNGQPISFSVVNEMLPTTNSGPYSLTLYTDNPVIVLSAEQSGAQSTFNYNWLGACGGNPTPPPAPIGFAIVGATLFSCNPAGPNSKAISFTPQYSGTNGQPISFSVANEMLPTTASGPYSLTLYTDNPVITLKAIQQGTPDQGSYSFNWLAACGSQTSGARVSAELNLAVRVLGNPVAGEVAEVEISGAAGGPVSLNLVNTQGRVLHKHTISEAASVERVRIPISGSKELLMLNVSTPSERKTIKLMKQ
ncbi:T9SS type A sorting domain-containing protein [Spirosoma flavus]